MSIVASIAFYAGLNRFVVNTKSVEFNQRCLSLVNSIIGIVGCFFVSNYFLVCHLVGFVVWDLLYRLWYYDQVFMLTSIIHHLVYGTASYVALSSTRLLEVTPYITIGELSTVFLDLVGILKLLSDNEYLVIKKLFAITFTITRVVILPIGLFEMYSIQEEWVWQTYYCYYSVVAMYALNLYWFMLILQKIKLLRA